MAQPICKYTCLCLCMWPLPVLWRETETASIASWSSHSTSPIHNGGLISLVNSIKIPAMDLVGYLQLLIISPNGSRQCLWRPLQVKLFSGSWRRILSHALGYPARSTQAMLMSSALQSWWLFVPSTAFALAHSANYFPQGYGLAESSNKNLIRIIKKVVGENKRSWNGCLKFAL